MAERLCVYRDSRLVGTLERERTLTFAYTDAIVADPPESILVSASLKVRARPYSERELLPFFDGLLPEGTARERLADRFHVDYGDVFGLLRELGRDCAGALTILPEGDDPELEAGQGVLWLKGASLAELVDNLDQRPLGVQPEKDVRLSLAGVQDKAVVVVDPQTGMIGLPKGTTPSTHLLKPAPKGNYPGLVLNEAYCSVLAEEAGLAVACVNLITVEGSPVLLVERYDRRRIGDSVERLHQEDFCQALRVTASKKYQAEGGPDLRRMVEFLNRISSDAAADVERLLQWELFNFLVGNSDGHAKNLSMLYSDQNRLAPAYDLVSTKMFDLKPDMGQSIGGEYLPDRIGRGQWEAECRRLGLNSRLVLSQLDEFASRVVEARPRADARLQASGHWNEGLESIGRLIRARAEAIAERV